MLPWLTLTCVLECTLGMFSAVWSASRNGSMMFGHMTSPWPITWRRGVYLGKISIWLFFFPIFTYLPQVLLCSWRVLDVNRNALLRAQWMCFCATNECSLNNPKNNRNAKHYIHFSYLDSIVSAGIGTFVKYSHNAPVFVKCSFIRQPVIVVCSSPDGFTSLLWHWNIWKERIKSSQATDKAEILTWKSTASSRT